jgi:hypothetical protein
MFWLWHLIGISYGQGQNWEVVGTMPVPVSNAQAILDGGRINIIGGYCDSLEAPVNFTQVYYPTADRWKEYSLLANNRSGFAADKFGNQLLIFGGISDSVENLCLLESWDFNDTSLVFKTDSIFNRVFANGLVYNEFLYLIGGYPWTSSGEVVTIPYIVEYNLLSNQITFVEDQTFQKELPYQQFAVRLQNDIYIFGGVYFNVSNKIYRFNLISHTLTQLSSTLLTPRAGGALVKWDDNTVILIGGYNESDPALASVEILTIDDDDVFVSEGPPLVNGRRELMAAKWYDYILVFGGKNNRDAAIYDIEKIQWPPATSVVTHPQPSGYVLEQNYPNPFNASTRISFSIPHRSRVRLDIVTPLGQVVETLVDGAFAEGHYAFHWNGTDSEQRPMASGVYFFRLATDSGIQSKKMVLIR